MLYLGLKEEDGHVKLCGSSSFASLIEQGYEVSTMNGLKKEDYCYSFLYTKNGEIIVQLLEDAKKSFEKARKFWEIIDEQEGFKTIQEALYMAIHRRKYDYSGWSYIIGDNGKLFFYEGDDFDSPSDALEEALDVFYKKFVALALSLDDATLEGQKFYCIIRQLMDIEGNTRSPQDFIRDIKKKKKERDAWLLDE